MARSPDGEPSHELGSEGERWMRRGHRFHLVTRLLVGYTAVTAVVFGALVYQLVNLYSTHYRNIEISSLLNEVPEYSSAASVGSNKGNLFIFTESYLAGHQEIGHHILLVNLFTHPLVGTSGSSLLLTSKVVRETVKSPPVHTKLQYIDIKGSPYVVATSSITEGKQTVGVFLAATSLASVAAERNQAALISLAEAAFAVLFSLLGGYLLLRRIMSTIGNVTDAAVQIYEGDLTKRLARDDSDDELSKLSGAFNLMITRISKNIESQRNLLADVSHQLRTPLTVMRGNLDLLSTSKMSVDEVREVVGVLGDEIEYMSSMVDRLLLLERASYPDFLSLEEVDFRSFIYDTLASAKMLGERNWVVEELPDALLACDSSKLRGALLNLLENAFKATQESGTILLGAQIGEKSGIEIWVVDDGKGIAREQLIKIFDRFDRGAGSYSRGAGLGLAIVKAVVEAHGGTVRVSSAIGEGSTFTIRLPISLTLGSYGNEGDGLQLMSEQIEGQQLHEDKKEAH